MTEENDNTFHGKVDCILNVSKNVFGEFVDYIPRSTGSPKRIRAIFDEVYVEVDPNTDASVSSNSPVLGINMDDLPDKPRRNDKVIRILNKEVIEYKVVDSQEDGQGGATLILQRTKLR